MRSISLPALLSAALAGLLGLPLLGALAAGGSEAPAPWTAQEERGRAIYRTGKTPDGPPLLATLGDPSSPVAASLLPCVNCHGADGHGRPEGSGSPPDITWPALTHASAVERGDERSRPPYDRRLFIRAVTLGVDSGGQPLAIAMPRFRLQKMDAEALADYVGRLDKGSE